MSEQDNTAPAVWDPTARDGAGGWVRRGEPRTTPLRKTEPADAPPSDAPPAEPTVPGTPTDRVPMPPADLAPPHPTPPPMPAVPPSVPPTLPAFPAQQPPTVANPYAAAQAAPAGYGPPGGYPPPYQQPGHQQPQQGFSQPYQQQPAYQQPYAPPQPEPEPRRTNMPLLIAIVVVVAALLGVGAVWGLGLGKHHDTAGGSTGATTGTQAPTGAGTAAPPSDSASASASASPSSSAAAKSQADAVDALLARSANDRKSVASAATDAGTCTNLTAAKATFQAAAADRQQLITELGSTDVSQLPDGAAMVQALTKAEQDSVTADNAFATWVGSLISGGCTAPGPAPQNADYTSAVGASSQATTDKKSFVVQWSPVAAQYGLHLWTENEL